MQPKETVRLLILDISQNDAEDLVNLLRNAGQPTQALMVESEDALVEALNSKTWDLCFAHIRATDFTPFQLLANIKKLELDIPVILLNEPERPDALMAALEAGIKDAVLADNHEHLLLVAKRELSALTDRRRRRKAEISLREAEKRCQLLLKSSRDAISYVHDGMHIYANQAYVELFGYTDFEEDLEGMPIIDMVTADCQDEFKQFLRDYSDGKTDANEFNCQGIRDDDSQFTALMSFSAAQYDGEDCTQLIIRTESNTTEQVDISGQDLVSGLMNISSFQDHIENTIERASGEHTSHAVLYISLSDIVHYKNKLGPAGTNLLIGDIANTLKQEVERPHLLARVDDYGMGVLLFDKDPSTAAVYAETLQKKVSEHQSQIGSETIQIDSHIGITVVNENTTNAREIISKARDAADFALKSEETDTGIHLHSADGQDQAHAQKITDLLAHTMEYGLFKLVYQPIVSLRGDSGEHYEVLLRMPDEEGNDVSPNEFIKEATNKGLIRDMERWAVEQTITRLADHISKGHTTHIMLNISADSFMDASFLPWLSGKLNETRMPGNSLIFQISETDATANLKEAKDFIKGINQLHCKAAITHFGRAINPFNTLKHLPVGYVKLDSTFVTDLSKEDDSKEEIKTIVSSLHTQGKLTIAPFVDSASLLPVLWQAGVNYIQGYYIQQPSGEMDYDFSMDEDD